MKLMKSDFKIDNNKRLPLRRGGISSQQNSHLKDSYVYTVFEFIMS